jgi:hypothetical protein
MLAGQFQTPPDRQAVASETSAPESEAQHGKICALVVVASRESLTGNWRNAEYLEKAAGDVGGRNSFQSMCSRQRLIGRLEDCHVCHQAALATPLIEG